MAGDGGGVPDFVPPVSTLPDTVRYIAREARETGEPVILLPDRLRVLAARLGGPGLGDFLRELAGLRAAPVVVGVDAEHQGAAVTTWVAVAPDAGWSQAKTGAYLGGVVSERLARWCAPLPDGWEGPRVPVGVEDGAPVAANKEDGRAER